MPAAGLEYFSPLVPALFPFQLIEPDIPGHCYQEGLDAGIPTEFIFPYEVNEGYDRLLENVLPVLQAATHRHYIKADQLRIVLVDVENYFVQVVGKNTGYNSLVG